MIGFAPGVAYLGALPKIWDIPRLAKIQSTIPAGSLSIAIRQTVLYTAAFPCGWCTIGRTPFVNFDATANPPVTIAAADEVQFQPICAKEFHQLSDLHNKGKLTLEHEVLE